MQYHTLQGSDDLLTAEKIFLVNQANIHAKMLQVTLDRQELLIESSALYFIKGQLQLESSVNGGLTKA